MNKRLLLGALALASFVGIGIYRLRQGINEENAVIADFNKDGKKDMIYLSPAETGNVYEIMFVDGKHVKKRDGRYLRTSFGNRICFVGRSTNINYDISAADMNGDGNMDLVVQSANLRLDPVLYANARDIYLGDGKGNFALSPGSNLTGR